MNRTLVRLLGERAEELRARYGIEFSVTGIASRRLGWIADAGGVDAEDLTAKAQRPDTPGPLGQPGAAVPTPAVPTPAEPTQVDPTLAVHTQAEPTQSVRSWLEAARADIMFEATSLSVENGQPAIDHIRVALEHGAHAITANKGPIVHAYRELRDLAAARGKRFLFESTVMDGIPIFSLFDQLPAIHLQGFHGILNSTTNLILGEMEQGLNFDEALAKAQALGVAETDASHDIDAWDAAVKTAALITVLMDVPVRLEEIEREGIRELSGNAVRNARRDGWPFKLVCRAKRTANGVQASVRPEKVMSTQPMARISGTSSYVYFETDIFPGLAVTEENPGLYATAYGMLADFVRAVWQALP